MEFHGLARDVSKNDNSKKIVAVFTDPEGVLGLGLGNVMVSKVALNKLLEDNDLDEVLCGIIEDAVDTIKETIDNSAIGDLDPIRCADDFKVGGKLLGDVSKDEDENSPEKSDHEENREDEEVDLDPHFEDPDSIEKEYGSDETDELDFDKFEL